MPSSVIESMQYEPGRKALLIAFRGGRGVYRYFDVSEPEWEAFRHASSKGTYLNKEFKRRGHPFVKLALRAAAMRAASRLADRRFTWPTAEKEPEAWGV